MFEDYDVSFESITKLKIEAHEKQFKGYIFRYSGDKTPVEKIRSHRKPVRMYSLDGTFIKEFKSTKEAARTMNLCDTHIIDCCKGKYTQSGGFIWEYA